MLREVKKYKLEGERWEIERERGGKLGWKVWNGKMSKEERKKEWEKGREERKGKVVGISDASKEEYGRMGIGEIW